MVGKAVKCLHPPRRTEVFYNEANKKMNEYLNLILMFRWHKFYSSTR